MNTGNHNLPEAQRQKPQGTNTGVRNLTCKGQIAGGSEKTNQKLKLKEPGLEGDTTHCEFCLRILLDSHSEIEEKSLCTSLREGEKGTIFKYSQNILIFLTRSAFKGN